jgi:hypothetical protein
MTVSNASSLASQILSVLDAAKTLFGISHRRGEVMWE